MSKNQNNFTFFDHLEELRDRLIRCLIVFVCLSLVAFFFVKPVLAFVVKPVGTLVFTSPSDALTAHLQIAFLIGFFASLPLIIWESWQFVAIGLKENERGIVIRFVPVSFFLFLLGAVFGYFVLLPFSLKFLLGFGSEILIPMITIKEYISYIGTIILACGVIFELPLVLFILTKIGIATPAFLSQKRRHAVVIIFIVSAIITPPDVFTQLIMAVPLLVLYELGIIFSKMSYNQK